MQFVRFSSGSAAAWGVLEEDTVYSLASLPEGEPTYRDFTNPNYVDRIETEVAHESPTRLPLTDVSLLAPVPRPGKIVCVGLNYHDHAEEQDETPPDEPLLFAKAPTTVTNPESPIVHPPGEEVDYEVELGVVIGQSAKDVSPDEVDSVVAGYTVVNDVSGRSAQFADGQFFRGKSYDTFSPMGPTLVVDPDYDPNAVDVALRVDGETKQSSNTDQFVFDVHETVSYISRHMTLRPGDVISTGTPGGVGIFRDPVDLLEPGMVCEAEIEGIGVLRNPVVAK